ncbi:MAG TPA: hypothetical protein VHC18_06735 [Amycolatopsis sp.]|nr:hypothetical protein [Amycolatopsis sp.]
MPGGPANAGERALGFFHLLTGLWLMYLTWATVLNLASGFDLPLQAFSPVAKARARVLRAV